MKHVRSFMMISFWVISIPGLMVAQGQKQKIDTTLNFDSFFIQKSLRIDFILAGNHTNETACLQQMKQEPNWGGNKKRLIDPLDLGSYRVMVTDSASGKVIFTKGFSTLFQEWRGTPEANLLNRAFEQTVILPFPKKIMKVSIQERAFSDGHFFTLLDLMINPNDYNIVREKPQSYPFIKFRDQGDPAQRVDVAILPEGYTSEEMSKFIKDAQIMSDYFLTVTPFSENKTKFNFYAIIAPSIESGVDIPGRGKYSNTAVNSTFYTFGMDRYLTTSDTRKIYDIAAVVPYDAVFILVNSNMYGGGGFYNLYAEITADNPWSKIAGVHEFGHSFAGLADEYMGDVNYSDTYNLKVEPWEPNITTNVDFSSKWQTMIQPETPVPTPRTNDYKNSVGMFEGGGYVTKGIYSPFEDCRMKSNEATGFCPVCQRAIRRMIQYYTGE
ncbi:MAG: M64 family metallopeptidase [Bacteroidota bacterium]